VVPERCFAVDFGDKPVLLSEEHTEYAWLDYEQARKRLKWDSNRNALWELRERLNAELREQ
jgi:dATP pyrophosphohydrolase